MTEENTTYEEMIGKPDVPDMPERLIKQSFKALEHNYDITQRAKMEATHNGIVRVINEQQARPEHVLLVLEVLRSEIVNSCSQMFFAPPPSQQTPPALPTQEPEPSHEEPETSDDMEETAME